MLAKPYIKFPLLFLYVVAQGFFIGLALIWTLPNIPGIPWPYDLIPGYGLGLLLSWLVTFLLLKKWRAGRTKKIIGMLASFVVICVACLFIAMWAIYQAKLRAIEILGVI